ncbi:hypothetical protein T4B_8575 [Trichinella pseudospiralis]|uniref:Uncharacterized protein n=1 Tax=Trichinella pseudospiralis TaxID=6337 RepID=A0A0V1GHF1_TRIPS|nr:hypothetical protein T4B_8575 [Trichinella pseudospiralis]
MLLINFVTFSNHLYKFWNNKEDVALNDSSQLLSLSPQVILFDRKRMNIMAETAEIKE